MTVPQYPSWCPGGTRYPTDAEFSAALPTLVANRNAFWDKCSSRVFDPSYQHCDSDVQQPFVNKRDGSFNELVLLCSQAQTTTSLKSDFVQLSSSSTPALPFVSPSGLGTWTFARGTKTTPDGIETPLTWQVNETPLPWQRNISRVGKVFGDSGQEVELPAIGPASGTCLIEPCEKEGHPDVNSVPFHPGHADNLNMVIVFQATVNVIVSGYVKELGVHCGGIDIYFYSSDLLIASKDGLNDDTAFNLPVTAIAAGTKARVIINQNGWFDCDHSSVSLDIVQQDRGK